MMALGGQCCDVPGEGPAITDSESEVRGGGRSYQRAMYRWRESSKPSNAT
jgi:hypothetical protein